MAKIPSLVFVIIGLIICLVAYLLDMLIFIWIGVIILAFGIVKMVIGWIGRPKRGEAPPDVVNLTNIKNNPYDKEAAQVNSAILQRRAMERARQAKQPKK